ncbi:MAG: hypothetical protein V1644_01020, partial [Candidatus Micrarchaeota archaeon]
MKFVELAFVGIVLVIIVVAVSYALKAPGQPWSGSAANVSDISLAASPDIKSFSSWSEVKDFLKSASPQGYGYRGGLEAVPMMAVTTPAS